MHVTFSRTVNIHVLKHGAHMKHFILSLLTLTSCAALADNSQVNPKQQEPTCVDQSGDFTLYAVKTNEKGQETREPVAPYRVNQLSCGEIAIVPKSEVNAAEAAIKSEAHNRHRLKYTLGVGFSDDQIVARGTWYQAPLPYDWRGKTYNIEIGTSIDLTPNDELEFGYRFSGKRSLDADVCCSDDEYNNNYRYNQKPVPANIPKTYWRGEGKEQDIHVYYLHFWQHNGYSTFAGVGLDEFWATWHQKVFSSRAKDATLYWEGARPTRRTLGEELFYGIAMGEDRENRVRFEIVRNSNHGDADFPPGWSGLIRGGVIFTHQFGGGQK